MPNPTTINEDQPMTLPETIAKLLPCPFCGPAEIKIYDTTENWESSALTVTCSKCTASIRVIAKCGTDDKAREVWNRRDTPAPKKTDEELVEMMVQAWNLAPVMVHSISNKFEYEQMRAALAVVRGAS